MSQEKKRFLLRNKIIVAVLLCLVAVVAVTGFVVAKYVSDNQRAAEIHASGFHFSSDYLETNGNTLTVSDWDTQGIVFRLYNYEKENVAQISDAAIDYQITVPAGWQISSVVTDSGETVSKVNELYTMAASKTASGHVVTLKYIGTGQPDSAEVTVAAVSPYAKTLKATFQITAQSGPTFTMTDCGGAVYLTICSNNYEGSIRVTWPGSAVSPDNANSDVDMSAWQNTNAASGQTFTAEAHHTYTLYFMKNKDSATIQKSDFSVERGS